MTFNGLGAGEYTIEELVAPDGYNLLGKPIVINITGTYVNPETQEGAVTTKPSIEWSVETKDVEGGNIKVTDGIVKITIGNASGQLLPSTGGAGTTLIYIIGGALIVGAGALLVFKKKKEQD